MNAYLQVNRNIKLFCPSDEVTVDQLRHVVVNELNKIPERWHGSFVRLAIEALAGKFPCGAP